MGGRKVAVVRPRCRTVSRQEVPLETYTMFQQEDMLAAAVLGRMLYGLSTRKYTQEIQPIDSHAKRLKIAKMAVPKIYNERETLWRPWIGYLVGYKKLKNTLFIFRKSRTTSYKDYVNDHGGATEYDGKYFLLATLD